MPVVPAFIYDHSTSLSAENNQQKVATITLLNYSELGITQHQRTISIADAQELIKIIQQDDAASPDHIFDTINYISEEKNMPSHISPINQRMKKSLPPSIYPNYAFNANKMTTSILDILCHINVKMLGLGIVLGTHSIPIESLLPGVDLLAGFIGLGSIDVTGGIFDDSHRSGICCGGMLGFAGTMLLVIIPMIPGPFIYIDGVTFLTFWL